MNRRTLLKSILGAITFGLLGKSIPAATKLCKHDFQCATMKCKFCGVSFENALEDALQRAEWNMDRRYGVDIVDKLGPNDPLRGRELEFNVIDEINSYYIDPLSFEFDENATTLKTIHS